MNKYSRSVDTMQKRRDPTESAVKGVDDRLVVEPRPGPSNLRAQQSATASTPLSPTGIPIVDIATRLGPIGQTYDEEYKKLFEHLKNTNDVLGPSAPVIFVNSVRKLYRLAVEVTNDLSLRPYDKCVFLFRIFDGIVLAYKNIGFVYCDEHGARSVYGYSESVLKNLLARVEAMAANVAVAVHDTYSLTVLNEVVAGTEQRLSQVQSEKDLMDLFHALSGGPLDVATRTAGGSPLPHGIERYGDPYANVDALLRLLYRFAADNHYVRDFHDAVYLLATANAPSTLPNALESRLAEKDRNIVLLETPGDRTFASSLCASAIGYLRKTLNRVNGAESGGGGERPSTGNDIEAYRINYGRIFSKYRGESERNFSQLMEWIKSAVRGGDRLRVFWFPDIENLMAPRTSNDQEHIAAIKNAMLQHMDDFNKDKTLRSFLLLFNSSEGALDIAFSRRLETAIRTPSNPLNDPNVAAQAVAAELARYRINLSDERFTLVAAGAATDSNVGTVDQEGSQSTQARVGGFAYVRATLRDMYVNQKLALKYGALAVDVTRLTGDDLWRTVFGRYHPSYVLYDLEGRGINDVTTVTKIAFAKESRFASRFDAAQAVPVRYNSSVRGDPKDLSERDAAQTVYLHDL